MKAAMRDRSRRQESDKRLKDWHMNRYAINTSRHWG
jgi:hypothetical protein